MDFELSAEQAMLREATRDVLRDRAGSEQVRAELGPAGGPQAAQLWQLGAELGWTGLTVPEEHGGSGQGLVELVIVAEEFGRAAARGAVTTSALAGTALTRHGSADLRAEVLPGLAAGSTRAAWAFAEPARPWTLEGIETTARAEGDGYVLNGTKTAVEDAPVADFLLVAARCEGVPALFLVGAADAAVRPQTVIDLTRSFGSVRFDEVPVPANRKLDADPGAIQRLLDDAAILTCADGLGVMERLLEMTVGYTAVRKQFGRPIGSFQAVKHGAADMAIAVQGARAAVYQAAMAADAGVPSARVDACVAASHVSAVLPEVAGEALQLHGGIGFTWEHELHLYLRRAKADETLHGDATIHRERLCSLLEHSLSPA